MCYNVAMRRQIVMMTDSAKACHQLRVPIDAVLAAMLGSAPAEVVVLHALIDQEEIGLVWIIRARQQLLDEIQCRDFPLVIVPIAVGAARGPR